MASKAMKRAVVIGVVFALATLGLVIYSAVSSWGHLCEVCVTFQGRTECREAYGQTQDEAVSTAQQNACGLLTSGMSNTIECTRTPPTRVTCK